MAFGSLSERLRKAFKNIAREGKLSEKSTNDMLREVRMSLLEASVSYGVAKGFIARVKEQVLGVEVMTFLNPGQMVVKIIHDEIVALLGSEDAPVNYGNGGMTTVMIVGLQGTGKTTAFVKITNVTKKKQSRKPLLIACGVIRLTAIEQLKTLGEGTGVEVFSLDVETRALETAEQAMDHAKEGGYDIVPFDTAERLHTDEGLMQELSGIEVSVHPDDILLAVDAMIRQDTANVAGSFHEQLEITGLVLAELNGNSRGGGILSVRSITQAPIKSAGLGEEIGDLGAFHPDRTASRILGMGDIMSLVEQTQNKTDIEADMRSVNRTMSEQFTLTDTLVQFQQLEEVGSLGGMMKLTPGMNQLAGQTDEAKAGNKVGRNTAIIRSMAMEEWENPNILRASRKNRIVRGSGATATGVNRLLNEYEKMRQVMKQMGVMTESGKIPNVGGMGVMGAMKNIRSMSKMIRQGGKRGKR